MQAQRTVRVAATGALADFCGVFRRDERVRETLSLSHGEALICGVAECTVSLAREPS